MSEVKKQLRRTRFFSPSSSSAPPPFRADITKANDVREGLHKAAARASNAAAAAVIHDDPRDDVAAWLQETNSSSPTGSISVRPATDVDQLQRQVFALTRAFEREFGRQPTLADGGYWKAYTDLVAAYRSAHVGELPAPSAPPNGTGS